MDPVMDESKRTVLSWRYIFDVEDFASNRDPSAATDTEMIAASSRSLIGAGLGSSAL